MHSKIYINDMGAINALGCNKAEIARALLTNKTALKPYDQLFSGRKTYVGQVSCELPALDKRYAKIDCRNNRMLLAAFSQIQKNYRSLSASINPARIAVILGTSTAGILESEQAYIVHAKTKAMPRRFHYHKQEFGKMAQFVADLCGAKGPIYTISTACSSSGKTFMVAKRLIEANICELCIVGGSDTLSQVPLNGFDALDSMTSNICKPFQIDRDGINIGEGASLFILSKHQSEIIFVGGGETSDAYHITAPDPEGMGAKVAMLKALKDANLNPDDIGYINTHGTATQKNDEMESKAIFDIFTDQVYCSSTKPLTGHTLGAASATELGLCWLLLSTEYNPDKQLPAQVGNDNFDPNLPKIKLTGDNSIWQKPYFMSNSFAFGGNNISLIIAANSSFKTSLSKE